MYGDLFQQGFAVLVALWLLTRTEKRLDRLTGAIEGLRFILARLVSRWDEEESLNFKRKDEE